jgi:hypothetical protein
MEIIFRDGILLGRPENQLEVEALLAMGKPVVEKKAREHIPYKRTCPVCGEQFQGRKGVAVHKRRRHGILGRAAQKAVEPVREIVNDLSHDVLSH